VAGNIFGELFRISTFGESHGGAVGVVIDGCPPGLAISQAEVQAELDRRKPGQSDITTPRKEEDTIQILSGVFEGETTGTPILMLAHNKDVRSEDYHHLKELYRPSHADFTYQAKYGRRDWRGSGRASARETLARVAAGAVAKKLLKEQAGVEIVSYVEQVGSVHAQVEPAQVTIKDIESNIVRCPDSAMAVRMVELIEEHRSAGDSVGGIVLGVVRGLPVGWGEPVFDRMEADLGKAMMSLPASKGFDVGSGFDGVTLTGREHNDAFRSEGGQVRTVTNRSGGIQGGITNGETVYFRVAFKPVATVMHEQDTVDVQYANTTLKGRGRHDPCVLPRAVPMVEAMAALVLIDHALRHEAQCGRY